MFYIPDVPSHNLKVVGSNPTPETNENSIISVI